MTDRKKAYKKQQAKKKRLRSKADKLWYQACIKQHGDKCELCGKPAGKAHHFFPKGQYAHLRYDLDNGICLCLGCHYRLHFSDISLEAEIVRVRKSRWYSNLHDKAQRGGQTGLNTISWYVGRISELNAYLEEYA